MFPDIINLLQLSTERKALSVCLGQACLGGQVSLCYMDIMDLLKLYTG